MQLKAGSELEGGKYRIIRVLGQGGFGITYLAEHTMLDKMVAIKEFFPKEYCDRDKTTSHLTIGTQNSVDIVGMLKTKFIKEAKNISKLSHKNIITIHDIFTENDTAYYVMEYVDGESLSQIVKNQGPLSESKSLRYIRKVADAVGYMHSLSMNHLDLKPANIMIRTLDDEPILIDFGLSKQYDASGSQTSTTPIGISHGYAPIEQYRPGGVATFSPQTDVYALGATLYALLSGNTPPHYSDILEDGLPQLSSNISEKTFSAIESAMETKRVKRPESVEIFLAMLDSENSPEANKGEDTPYVEADLLSQESEIEAKADISSGIDDRTLFMLTNLNEYSHMEADLPSDDSPAEFVDLGLHSLWARRRSGIATPVAKSVYTFHLNDGQKITPEKFLSSDHELPSICDFEDLIQRCRWSVCSRQGYLYYKIVGPNGNFIEMPMDNVEKVLTRQSLELNLGGCGYLMYINRFNYSLGVGVPDKAMIWEIKGKSK